jgi:hypothetical protein
VTVEGGFREYLRVCTTNLCNSWDGIAPGPGGGSGGGGVGGGGGGGRLEAVGVVMTVMVLAMISRSLLPLCNT